MNIGGLDPTLRDLATALGIANAGGDLQTDWFANPLSSLETVLSDDEQRAALLDLLDREVPAATLSDIPAGEQWHPLLPDNDRGNLYLTVKPDGAAVRVGLGARFGTAAAAPLQASLLLALPCVELAGNATSFIAGTATAPLSVALRVEANLTRAADGIGLRAARAAAVLAPRAAPAFERFAVTLEGLDLDGSGPRDLDLQPDVLDHYTLSLVIGLVVARLRVFAGGGGAAGAIADNLPALLGLADAIPPFPFAAAGSPGAVRAWLANLLADPAAVLRWFGHLSALLGGTPAASGTGTADDPWRVIVLAQANAPRLELTLASVAGGDGTTLLQFGLALSVAPNAGTTTAIEGHAVLFAVPIRGTGAVSALPNAFIGLRAPSTDAAKLVPGPGAFTADTLRAVISWDGAKITPQLALLNVTIDGIGYPRVDLSNVGSVVGQVASAAVRTSIMNALGAGDAASSLAALATLVAPQADPAMQLADLTALVADPAAEIARRHRAELVSAAGWAPLLAELGSLMGLGRAVAGTGSPDDPWTIAVANIGPVALSLAAWNAQTSGNAADIQQLRIGLDARAATADVTARVSVSLLGFDLPQSGAVASRLFAETHFLLDLAAPALSETGGISVSADSVRVSLLASADAGVQARAEVINLRVADGADSITVPSIGFPGPANIDVLNPLGIGTAALEQLVSLLAADGLRLHFGSAGTALAALAGLSRTLPGIDAAAPTLRDLANPGAIFASPSDAFRGFIRRLATTVGGDGRLALENWGGWLAAALGGALPTAAAPPDAIPGSGSYEDPWRLRLVSPDTGADALLWLEPAGLPLPAGLADAIAASDGYESLLDNLDGVPGSVADAMRGRDVTQLIDALAALDQFFATSDGVVPTAAQQPSGGAWTAGPVIAAAHERVPADAAAINAVLARLNVLSPGDRVVLLLAPGFLDRTAWQALLAAAEADRPGRTDPGAYFDLRDADPNGVDLRTVTAAVDYYVADIAQDGSGALPPLTQQIDRIVGRLAELRPGVTPVLVAHSTVGVAARDYAAANSAKVHGLITLASPHAGSTIPPLSNPALADALRFLGAITPAGPGGAVGDAVNDLLAAGDGWLPPAAGGQLPRRRAYPVAAFSGSALTDTAGVPAFAVAAALPPGLLASVTAALAAFVRALPAPAPTHVACGVELDLGLPTDAGTAVVATVRCDLARLSLADAAAEPARPNPALTLLARLDAPDGWLLGAPSEQLAAGPRLRRADIGVALTSSPRGLSAAPIVSLYDAALASDTRRLVAAPDPALGALLGALLQDIADPAPAATTPVGAWLNALLPLGLAAADGQGGIALTLDGLNALQLDPVGFAAPRLAAALAAPSGLLGFVSDTGGWRKPIGGTPLRLTIGQATPSFGLACDSLPIAAGVSLAFELGVNVATMQPFASGGLTAGAARLSLGRDGTVSLAIPPWLDPVTLLPPPPAAQLQAAFGAALPRFLFDTAASALLSSLAGPGHSVTGIGQFLAGSGQWLVAANALGDGTQLSSARVNALLHSIATAIGAPAGPGTLPLGPFSISAGGSGMLDLTLQTPAALGGLNLALTLSIDAAFHATPSGTIAYHTALAGPEWPGVTVAIGIGPDGMTLSITPDGRDPITLLPHFSGLGVLAGGAAALLPTALDRLVAELGPATPLVALSLDVAQALDLYDGGGGFTAHTAQLQEMLQPGWLAGIGAAARATATTRIASLFNDVTSPLRGVLPGAVTASGTALQWTANLAGGGSVTATIGWDEGGPTIFLTVDGFAPGGSGIVAAAAAGYRNAAVSGAVTLTLQAAAALHLGASPQLTLSIAPSGVISRLLPLGAGSDAILAIDLAPTMAVTAAATAAVQMASSYALPLLMDLILQKAGGALGTHLWSPASPTVRDVLRGAHLIDNTDAPLLPLQSAAAIAGGALRTLAAGIDVPIGADLHIAAPAGPNANTIGVRLHGHVEVVTGDPTISLRFGEPAAWITDPAHGVTLVLFDQALNFTPRLSIVGFGIGLNAGDSPLVNLDVFRLGGIDAYLFAEIDLATGSVALGAGLELDQLGLPLNQLSGASGDDPVAASLFQGSPGSGDPQPVNPAVDVVLTALPNAALSLTISGNADPTRAIVIPVHRGFGPIYINQLEIGQEGSGATTSVDLGIDGQVSVGGLTVSADGLGVAIPIGAVLNPGAWSLRLSGLAVAFSNGPLSIEGGLRKNIVAGTTEYDGMLSVNVAGRGFTAVGGYARPRDALGSYTSFFAFVSLPIPLGGPPFFFVTGIGGGFGYNRELLIPDDLSQIDSFPLVEAINNDLDANDPMAALQSMGQLIPAKRGAFFIAAGVRATTFVLVNERIIVAVSLDRGFELDILGIARMALPSEEVAIASVELALKVRFNSAEGVLSVQAQLTDNSYLFSHDCQLTGGFAFFMWFQDGQFVLTLGGYHPAFSKPVNFPDVPRLGFNWHVSDIIGIKGEAYFALTNSCVMAGGRLEASADFDVIKAWFTAYADLLIAWDPFHYIFDIGIEVGLTVEVEVCFFACAHISLTLKRGASLHIEGPPLHGSVTVDAYITSVTIPFGPDPQHPNFIDWNTFAAKYLVPGDPDAAGVDVHLTDGLLPPDPPGSPPLPGTQSQPWRIGAGFTFSAETRMAANSVRIEIVGFPIVQRSGGFEIDIAPMQEINVQSAHKLVIAIADERTDTSWFDPNHFTFDVTEKPFPEGLWLWQETIAARAGNITAYGGLTLVGQALLEGPSALIPFSSLADDRENLSLPLPFAPPPDVLTQYTGFGLAAEAFAAAVNQTTVQHTVAAAVAILSGGGVFSDGRTAIGVAPGGLSPLASQSLAAARAAPPRLAPLATGLSRKPVGLPLPPVIQGLPDPNPVVLDRPRLGAVFQHPTTPVAMAPAAIRTTVSRATAARGNVLRMRPPRAAVVLGARLDVIDVAGAPQPTRIAADVRTWRHPEAGGLVGAATAVALARAADDVQAQGVALAAGVTHLWDLPDAKGRIIVTGDIARLTCIDRAGRVVDDTIFRADGTSRGVHPDTVSVAITCLGKAPDFASPPAALALAVASAGRPPAVGWLANNRSLQLGSASLMCRGAVIRLAQPKIARRAAQLTTLTMVRTADALAGQPAVETRLPLGIGVVMIVLDVADQQAVDVGDFAAGVRGAAVSGPVVVAGGRRRALLYDVGAPEAAASMLAVSIASRTGWQLAGVVGLAGRAQEWAVRFDGAVPDDLVVDGPFTPDGSITVRMPAGS